MNSCPKCGSNWIGGEIPKDIVKNYSSKYWRREIGIDGGFLGIYDGIVAVMCPDCKEYFPRNDSKWAKEMYEQFIEIMRNEK